MANNNNNNKNKNKNKNNNYICEFCNVALIEKLDDKAHLGYQYNRYICPNCANIKDEEIHGENPHFKHAEGFVPLTDPRSLNNQAFAEVWKTSEEDYEDYDEDYDEDEDEDEEDDLMNFDDDEFENIRAQGAASIRQSTRSSVSGKSIIKEQRYDRYGKDRRY